MIAIDNKLYLYKIVNHLMVPHTCSDVRPINKPPHTPIKLPQNPKTNSLLQVCHLSTWPNKNRYI